MIQCNSLLSSNGELNGLGRRGRQGIEVLLLKSAELMGQISDGRVAPVRCTLDQSCLIVMHRPDSLELSNKPVLSRGVGGGTCSLSVSCRMVDIRWLVQARSLCLLRQIGKESGHVG